MFLTDTENLVDETPVSSKYAPKRNRCHPDDPAYERTVNQIRITKVLDRVQSFALGENDSRGRPIVMTNSQVKVAMVFLNQHIPDIRPV